MERILSSKQEVKEAISTMGSYNGFQGEIRYKNRYVMVKRYPLGKIKMQISYFEDGYDGAVERISNCSSVSGAVSKIARFLDFGGEKTAAAKEEAKRERERENRKKRAAAIKAWKEKKAAQATKAEEKKEEEPAKELNGIKKGDMVEHKKFGIGEVKQVNEKSFVIDFPKFGRKEIAAYFFANK